MSEEVKDTRPMPSIGVSDYTFFPVKSDTKTGTEYGEAVVLPGTVEIKPTDNGGVSKFDADNGAYISNSYIEKMGHDITNADIPPEVDAMWRGMKNVNGMVSVSGITKTPYFGVAWRVLKADATYRYVRYLKGSYSFASHVGAKTKPSDGDPDYQTAEATFTAVQRISDGNYYQYIDETSLSEGDKAVIAEKWFSDMSWMPASQA